MDADRFAASLVAFIEHDLLGSSSRAIDVDTYLFDEGVIDSLKILRLIAFIEHATGREIPDSEILMKNFRSVRTIAQHFWRSSDEHLERAVRGGPAVNFEV